MARATLPLLSASAQGSVGRCLTYSRRSGGNRVRYQRKQKDANTDNQIPRRLMVQQGVVNWQGFTDEQKDVYNNRAKGLSMSGYNLYMSDYLRATTPPEMRSIFGSRTYGYFEYGREVLN